MSEHIGLKAVGGGAAPSSSVSSPEEWPSQQNCPQTPALELSFAAVVSQSLGLLSLNLE